MIFDQHKAIFVHVPRTGGTSLKKTQPLREMSTYGHIRAREFQKTETEKFKSYFTFGFMRNPWDRLVSAYHHLMQGGDNEYDARFRNDYLLAYRNFQDFCLNFINKQNINKYIHFRPQCHWLCGSGYKPIVDFIGKYENYQYDTRHVMRKMGIDDSIEVPVHLPSRRQSYEKYYNQDMIDIVANVYEKDIELGGYEFKQKPFRFDQAFDKMFVVNIPSDDPNNPSYQRRQRVISEFEALNIRNYEILKAVNGYEIDINNLVMKGLVRPPFYQNTPITPGVIGCCQSHINLWRHIVKEGYDKVLVCEDDIQFFPGAHTQFDFLLRNVPNDWGIIHLFSHFEVGSGKQSDPKRQRINQWALRGHFECGGTLCYAIRKETAAYLLSRFKKCIDRPADMMTAEVTTQRCQFDGFVAADAPCKIAPDKRTYPSPRNENAERLSRYQKTRYVKIYGLPKSATKLLTFLLKKNLQYVEPLVDILGWKHANHIEENDIDWTCKTWPDQSWDKEVINQWVRNARLYVWERDLKRNLDKVQYAAVLRDPLDWISSSMTHRNHRGEIIGWYGWTLPDMVKIWNERAESWLGLANNQPNNCAVISYDKLINNSVEAIGYIAKTLGLEMTDKPVVTNNRIDYDLTETEKFVAAKGTPLREDEVKYIQARLNPELYETFKSLT